MLVGKVAGSAGYFAPLAFLLAALVAGFTAVTYAELSSRYPYSAGEAVYLYDQSFAERAGTYYRFDLGLSYKINKSKLTHTIMLDIQNITNRLNVFAKYFDEDTNQVETYYQNGFFPVFNYRIEF